jgi:hypothetical protein
VVEEKVAEEWEEIKQVQVQQVIVYVLIADTKWFIKQAFPVIKRNARNVEPS